MKKTASIRNLSQPDKQKIIVKHCHKFVEKLRGFMFRNQLEEDEGLLIHQARDSRLDSSIHMLCVFTKLAVFWINSSGEVVDKVLAQPWRAAYLPKKPAKYVLELHPSRIDLLRVGDHVEIQYG